jgi:protease IV
MNELNPHEPIPADDQEPTRPNADVAKATAATSNWERAVLEKLLTAGLDEQRRARRWKIFFRLAFLAVFALIAFGLLRPTKPAGNTDVSGAHTAVVQLTGEIALDTLASAGNINESLRAAFSDADSVAVILRINSPGGSPAQSSLINDEIYRLKALHKKPIYVVIDEICASGGYYVAVAADKIFVNKASLIGSIGVLMDGFGFTGLMEKLGVERRLLTAGENKGFLDPFSPQSERQRAHVQGMLAEIHTQFIDVVKKGRGAKLQADNPDLFSGLVFSGERGVALGLADGFGDTEFVAREVTKAEKLIDYTQKENVLDRVARRFGAAAGGAIVSSLRISGIR